MRAGGLVATIDCGCGVKLKTGKLLSASHPIIKHKLLYTCFIRSGLMPEGGWAWG